MDNLQWFKFSPADWMMGRIQRQTPQVQVDFLRLCCKYWQKDGDLSIEDAEIEAMDSYSVLVKYKIIKEANNVVTIDFLDEQFDSLDGKRKQASKAGKMSAEARRLKKEANGRSTDVQRNPTGVEISSTELNREEKSRQEKSRQEQESVFSSFNKFWELYGKKLDTVKCQREWSDIDSREYEAILSHVPKFVNASGQYLCKPLNYLQGRRWQDEQLPNYSDDKEPKQEKLVPYKINKPQY